MSTTNSRNRLDRNGRLKLYHKTIRTTALYQKRNQTQEQAVCGIENQKNNKGLEDKKNLQVRKFKKQTRMQTETERKKMKIYIAKTKSEQ